MQKLARVVIGTNNVDNCSRYCQSPATTGLFRTVGYGGDSGSISDVEKADLVLIIGTNTAESHPVIATRVKSAHKLDGQKLIVSDLRENEMTRRADLFLHPNPARDLVWINAASRYLLDNDLAHKKFLDQRVNGLEEYRKSLDPFSLEATTQLSGLSEETIRTVAHMISTILISSPITYIAFELSVLNGFHHLVIVEAFGRRQLDLPGRLKSLAHFGISHRLITEKRVWHGSVVAGSLHVVMAAQRICAGSRSHVITGNKKKVRYCGRNVGTLDVLGHPHRPKNAHALCLSAASMFLVASSVFSIAHYDKSNLPNKSANLQIV